MKIDPYRARAAIRMASSRSKYKSEAERCEARDMQQQERLQREREARHARGLERHAVGRDARPSPEALAERDALPPHASLTAAWLGDPRPGRSALDQRGGRA